MPNHHTDWTTARGTCQGLGDGWDLVDIQTVPENSFVESLITGRTWIGATDNDTLSSEGTWVYPDGSAAPLTQPPRNGGEPNDAGGNEDCAEMYDSSGLWNDMPCSTLRPAVCKGPRNDTARCVHRAACVIRWRAG